VAAPSQRKALGALFGLIAVFFVGIAVTAFDAARDQSWIWVIVFAAGALALWMASMSFRALRAR
jgi:Na+-transporting NADH:ubiquinone oxidoreductase subunit NqrE